MSRRDTDLSLMWWAGVKATEVAGNIELEAPADPGAKELEGVVTAVANVGANLSVSGSLIGSIEAPQILIGDATTSGPIRGIIELPNDVSGILRILWVLNGSSNTQPTIEGTLNVVDPDYTALLAEMVTPPDDTRKDLILDTIVSLKTAGIWEKLDCLYFMAAHDSQAARLNWMSPTTFTLTEVNSPTFTVDAGFRSNGTTSYLNSGWVGTTDAVHMFDTDSVIFVKESTTNFNTGFARNLGAVDTGSDPGSIEICTRSSDNNAFAHIMDNGIVSAANGDSRVLAAARRTANNDADLFINGTQVATRTTVDTPDLPTLAIYICARNTNGSASSFRASDQSVAGWGSALSDTEMTDLDTIIDTYMAGL